MVGLTEMHKYCKRKGHKLKLSCMVSLGCGTFQRKMENTDVHSCWSKIRDLKNVFTNTVSLISATRNLLFDILIHEVSVIAT